MNKLGETGVPCEVRQLAVGDFLWAARRSTSAVENRAGGAASVAPLGTASTEAEFEVDFDSDSDAATVDSASCAVANAAKATGKVKSKEKGKGKGKGKSKHAQGSEPQLVVLDCVAERKTR